MIKKTWYQLPEEQCERLNATEMRAVRWMLAALNSCVYAQKDLDNRLECIPSGKSRFRLMLGHLRAITNDMIGTTPKKQCRQIWNTMADMELRLVPKYTPNANKCIIDVADLSYLVSLAKNDMCTTCIRTGEECRKCELYKILESISPLNDWGSGALCPYNVADWMEK